MKSLSLALFLTLSLSHSLTLNNRIWLEQSLQSVYSSKDGATGLIYRYQSQYAGAGTPGATWKDLKQRVLL